MVQNNMVDFLNGKRIFDPLDSSNKNLSVKELEKIYSGYGSRCKENLEYCDIGEIFDGYSKGMYQLRECGPFSDFESIVETTKFLRDIGKLILPPSLWSFKEIPHTESIENLDFKVNSCGELISDGIRSIVYVSGVHQFSEIINGNYNRVKGSPFMIAYSENISDNGKLVNPKVEDARSLDGKLFYLSHYGISKSKTIDYPDSFCYE